MTRRWRAGSYDRARTKMAGRCANSPGPAQEVSAPMHLDSSKSRAAGTGSLLVRSDGSGSASWYGKWRVEGRQVMRRLGNVRTNGSAVGLTHAEADAKLQRAIEASSAGDTSVGDGLTLAEAGAKYLASREAIGLKRGTLQDYESYLRVHLVPFFAHRALEQVDIELVEAFVATKRREGKAVKSILNYIGLLHAIFAHATKRGWCERNPVALADKPRAVRNADIRFLSLEELEAILAATPTTPLGRTDRLLYLTAAMTGLRRGEARWRRREVGVTEVVYVIESCAPSLRLRRAVPRSGVLGCVPALSNEATACLRSRGSQRPPRHDAAADEERE